MKDVKIKIKSTQRDPDGDELDINIACDGRMELRAGRIYIKYEEDISGEGDIVENTVSFDAEERDIISLARTGGTRMSCVFEQGKRYPCTYELAFGALSLVISSQNVKNSISYDEGGEMLLEYTIESRGLIMQKAKYRLTVEKT